MSAAQREAIQKAWDILTEHFERVVVVADWDCQDEDDTETTAHEGWWHGGSMPAIGLCEFAKDRILHSGKKQQEPE